jgi:phosphatidyl-myo-inositol dimannoside synthase
MHDTPDASPAPYLSREYFRGFGSRRLSFVWKSVMEGKKSDIVVLSHIHLLWPGYLIKKLSPKTRVVLISHGIEAWKPLPDFKKKMLSQLDHFVAVSHYTKEEMKQLHDLPDIKFEVVNNCLDPFLPATPGEDRRAEFRHSYGFGDEEIVLLTLSRLSDNEKRKNYDKVLIAIKKLHKTFPQLRYMFVGKYEEAEKKRIEGVAHALGIEDDIIFTGYVPDSVIADFYNMADIYIMPSEKEGFGISFIEAMYYQKPVIAGNRDGSVDALANGEFGILVDPRDQNAITGALERVINNRAEHTPDPVRLMEKFGYPVYKDKWKKIFNTLKP